MSEEKLEDQSTEQKDSSPADIHQKQAVSDLMKKPEGSVDEVQTESTPEEVNAAKTDVPFNQSLLIEDEDVNPDYDPQLLERLHAEMQALLAKNRMSNMILILLIVLYVLALFFFNNWLMILILIIPMLALAIWDHRNLKQIRTIQAQINAQEGKTTADVSRYKSLNELPKAYTVVDEGEYRGLEYQHIILSPYGIDCISQEDPKEILSRAFEIPESAVFWISPDLSLEEQITQILSHHEELLNERQLFQILRMLNGLDDE